MSEERVLYGTGAGLLNTPANHDTIQQEPTPTLRADLEELERRLIPLLVTVQRALGKEPHVQGRGEKGLTRAERRRR